MSEPWYYKINEPEKVIIYEALLHKKMFSDNYPYNLDKV